jgi:ankyrin repeat protein
MVFALLQFLPQDIIDKIMSYLHTSDILRIGEENVSEYVWLWKGIYDLTEACEDNNIIAARYFIKNCEDLSTDWYRPMCYSAKHNYLDIVEYLVKSKNYPNLNKDIALRCAASYGNLEIMKYLIKQGAHINAMNNAAFRASASNGHLHVVRYIIKYRGSGAINNINEYETLRYITRKGHLHIIKYLVGLGADINVIDKNTLLWCIKNGHIRVIKYLVELGVNIGIIDTATMQYCAESGRLYVVKYLVERGTYIGAIDRQGILNKKKKGYLNVLKYLDSYTNSWQSVCEAAKNGQLRLVKYLIAERYINLQLYNILDAIEPSIINGHLHVLDYFIGQNHNLDYNSLLTLAIKNNQPDIIRYLVIMSADYIAFKHN